MRIILKISIFVLLISSTCFSQEPIAILKASWQRTVQRVAKPDVTRAGPVKALNADDKYFTRKAREARTDRPEDPYESSIEGRSAAIDKAVQESRTPKADDIAGYYYAAEMRNDTGKTVQIIFWEFQFTEIARPTNVIRRQFLCAMKLKNGAKKELSVFSLLGPSDSIDVQSLAKSKEKLFNEEVFVNRIELADGAVLQRADWKYADVKEAVKRATSTPWEAESCRAL